MILILFLTYMKSQVRMPGLGNDTTLVMQNGKMQSKSETRIYSRIYFNTSACHHQDMANVHKMLEDNN